MIKPITSAVDAERWRTRIADRAVPAPNGCWLWTGRLDEDGYGVFRYSVDGKRRQTGAHRASWLAHRGDIPAGLLIDHMCRNPPCCNPDHLRLATMSENVSWGDHSRKKGRTGRRGAGFAVGCGKHGLEDGYDYTNPRGYTTWTCRVCRRARRALARAA